MDNKERIDNSGDGLPLSDEAESAGTAIIGERPVEYTFPTAGEISDESLMIGTAVVTEEGDALGTVGEVAADRFKISALLARDYWLPRDLISGVAPGGDLVVAASKDELDGVTVEPPESDE